MHEFDDIDIKLINLIQDKLPLSSKPFADIGQELQLTEQEIIARLERYKQQGYIRRIGAVFDSAQMGYYSTLCACKIEESRIDATAAIINGCPGVTHNYVRDDSRNLWFTLTAASKAKALEIVKQLEKEIGTVIDLIPAKKVYKIKVSFDMKVSHAI